jgi:uncharacterized DUF497 family protein
VATRFAWDDRKNAANRRKYGVGFETARLAFEDPGAIALRDRIVEGEQRWQMIGWAQSILLVVAHTVLEEEGKEVIRIISAAKGNPY